MENEFVPFELAVRLKDLGFDEPCLAYFNGNRPSRLGGEGSNYIDNMHQWRNTFLSFKDEDIVLTPEKDWTDEPNTVRKKWGMTVASPLWQQAFDWFREKHNIVQTIYCNASGFIWELHYNTERGGSHICDSGETGDCEMSGMFTRYEKAREACLEKLIELIEK